MTISYNWINELLQENIELDRLSKILTSVGLEVESATPFEEVKGGLNGLIVGEVISCEKHPDADKLKITKVNVGEPDYLQIVCGAPNVAVGQKVIVATIGTTIYPITGEPLTMKKAKIRGVESQGMLCAEDEIGIGTSHDGIAILPTDLKVGSPVSECFKPYNDYIIEIGLTPNHMDAQSHIGVARDVVAYINHHDKKNITVKKPSISGFKPDEIKNNISITVQPETNCERYSGVVIENITIAESPKWLQQKLKVIGVRPINNVVDITNYVLHETGQPLHAFDLAALKENTIIVKNATQDEKFISLDEKERKLHNEDVMICNATEPMCIGGVFGGLKSGVTNTTTGIFLESAVFNAIAIRKTSLRHELRTDAAIRFEKGVDISNTVNALKRAALLIKEIAGGNITSELVDIYPLKKEKVEVDIKYQYLKKLSGKNYHPETVKNILQHLGFEIAKDGIDALSVLVPYHKTDVNISADLVEEIMRIDGLDAIEIPKSISISPMSDPNNFKEKLKDKVATILVGMGLQEIFTNSITNSAWVNEIEKPTMVKMMNNLSAELDVMRTNMLQTGLPSIAHNINRKQNNLQFFEFGRIYTVADLKFEEVEQLAIYITGEKNNTSWLQKSIPSDLYYTKMVAEKILHTCGIKFTTISENNKFHYCVQQKSIATVCLIDNSTLKIHDIKQLVFSIIINWESLVKAATKNNITYTEMSKFPTVERDIAILVNKAVQYSTIENAILKSGVKKLQNINLFDVFENEKLGKDKKSIAINISFVDAEKTLIDKEIDGFMQKIKTNLEKEVAAEWRK